MPALIPPTVLAEAKTPEIQEAVDRGWELQVRGRVREHLEYWIDHYMPEGSCSVVYESKNKDYNVRFYTTREAYGEALKRQAMNIDYVKFKDTSENFPWGKKYHYLLLKVWGASTMLGRPYRGEDTAQEQTNWVDDHPVKRKRGSRRNSLRTTVPSWFDEDDFSPVRMQKSIHDMTDAELLDAE